MTDENLLESDLYDEFGNYIGPDESESEQTSASESFSDKDEDASQESASESHQENEEETILTQKIVLHEDKVYYPSAETVFGPKVEVLVQDEDTQPLEKPIIQPVIVKKFKVSQKNAPKTTYSKEYLADLMNFPERIRNFVLVGHLHAGKTTFVDHLVKACHIPESVADSVKYSSRYADCSILEKERGISLKAKPMSFVLPSSKGKSHLVCAVDTPGHVDFGDEVASAMRLADGAVLVVDAVEGVMLNTERTLRNALREGLPVVLVLNKIDRLFLELRLPPSDAYFKLKHTIDELNTLALSMGCSKALFAPERNNVLFASLRDDWAFSLRSFCGMYSSKFPGIDAKEMSKRLWGDIFYDAEKRQFSRSGHTRSFVYFVLEPIYKLYTTVLGYEGSELADRLASVDILLQKSDFQLDLKPLLKVVLHQFFGSTSSEAIVDVVSEFIPDPHTAIGDKLQHIYTGPLNGPCAKSMLACDPEGPLLMNITLIYPQETEAESVTSFVAFGRIFSGTLKKGQTVKILGETFVSGAEEEDSSVGIVEQILFYECQYMIETDKALAGSLVAIVGSGGFQSHVTKAVTVVDKSLPEAPFVFKPVLFGTTATVKTAIEPMIPAELPKMVEGLRKLSKSYPLLKSKVEESGEHVIVGPGELYLDCVLHDLRKLYSNIEIRVADPVCIFSETVLETSLLKCHSETPNHRNQLTMIAEPLDKGLAEDIETGYVRTYATQNTQKPSEAFEPLNNKHMAGLFQSKYGWDILAARSVWAFGPDPVLGPNMLIDDCLPSETNKSLLHAVKDHIVHGFRWTCREGPLCEEPVRGVKFRLLDAAVSQDPIYRGSGQVIPTARKVCYSSLLTASPRLMEPVYHTEIQTPSDCIDSIYTLLARRRGHVIKDYAKSGSPMCMLVAYVPVIDSFGFESDLRIVTQGQAFCQSVFDHWEVVPGDPLDKSLIIRALEPADAVTLARDFMLKTRHRKGLSEDVSVAKFFDDPMLLEMATQKLSLSSGI